MAQRILTFQGYAYEPSATVFSLTRTDPKRIQNLIANALLSYGWGVRRINVEISAYSAFSFYSSYFYEIEINTNTNDNEERVRLGVLNAINTVMTDATLSLVSDNQLVVNQSGQTVITDTRLDRRESAPSLWEMLFGEDSATDAATKVAGISVSTIVILGVVYLMVTSRGKQ